MTSDELRAIRELWWPEDRCRNTAARADVLALLDEVERLKRELQVERCGVRPVDEQLQRVTDERDELLVRVANADAELRATRESYNEAVRERDEARRIANDAVHELNRANVYAWFDL